MKTLSTLLLFCAAVLQIHAAPPPNYSKIWELFTNSNYTEAQTLIRQELKNHPNDEALLDLELQIIKNTSDYPKTIEYIRSFIEAAPNPNPFLQSNFELLSSRTVPSSYEKLVEQTLRELVNHPKLDATMTATLRDELGALYLSHNDRKKAEEAYAAIGSVATWSLLGPFENLMGNGFDKYTDVIENPQQEVFKGKYNALVSWYPLKYHIPGRWIHLENYCYSARGIVFAQTYCTSPIDQDVYIRIGISGSLKIFVNDALVMRENQEINNGIDAMSVKVHLAKGANRIVLQLGNSDANGRVNFNMRLTDEKFALIQGLTYSHSYAGYPKAVTKAPLPARSIAPYQGYFLAAAGKKGELEYYYKYKATQVSSYNEDLDYLEEAGSELLEKYPNCSLFYSPLLNFYTRIGNRTMWSELSERYKKLDPNSLGAVTSRISDAFEKENYPEVSSLLENYKTVIGNENYYAFKITLLIKEKKGEEAYALIDVAYNAYPNNTIFVELKASMENGDKKNAPAAIEVLSKYLENHYNLKLFGAYFYLKSNIKLESAVDDLHSLLDMHDYEDSPLYYGLGIYDNEYFKDDRIKLINKLLEYAPNTSNLFYRRAQAKLGTSSEEAVKDLKQALENYPYNFDAIALRRSIAKKPNIYDLFQNYDYDKLFAEVNSKTNSKSPGDADLEIILDEDQMVIYDRGAQESRRIAMYKILNEKGIDRVKEIDLPVYDNQEFMIEKAEVLKLNGNRLKGEVNDNKVVFTNLEKGDGILLIYKYKDYPIVGLNNHNIHIFPFNYFNYNHKRKITLLVDPAFSFNYQSTGFDFKPVKSKVDDFDSYVWEQQDVERIENEVSMPDYWDVAKYITLTSIPDWKYINNWYQILSNTSTENTRIIDKTVKKIFPNGPSKNQMDNAKKIYEYIVQNIRYSSIWFRNSGLVPQEVSKTISSKLGDCKDVALTFKTLAGKVGIQSNLILVNTKDNGTKQYDLPSIEFNHCMVKMIIDNKEYFLELTSDVNGFHTLGSRILNACYLEIGENSSNKIERINPPTRVKNGVVNTTVMNFEDEKLMVTKNVLFLGDYAAYEKSTFRNTELKDQEEQITGNLPDAFMNQQLVSFEFNKEQLTSVINDSLEHKYIYEVNSPFTKVANLSVLKLPFSYTKNGMPMLQTKQRVLPLCLWNSPLDLDYEAEKIEINIPKGKKIAELPATVTITNKYFDYTLSFTKVPGKCIASKECIYKTFDIPASEYQEFKKAIIKVSEAESVQLALQDGEDTPAPTKGKKGKK
ncbi:MAG: transglutaminase domain-containing protein [Candidatus Kapaibacterium sp.]